MLQPQFRLVLEKKLKKYDSLKKKLQITTPSKCEKYERNETKKNYPAPE